MQAVEPLSAVVALAATPEPIAAQLRPAVAQYYQLLEDELRPLEAEYRAAASRQPGEAPATVWTLAEILADPTVWKQRRAVVHGIAWEERATHLAAREKIGKTTLLASAVANVSSGSPFLGQPTQRGTALVLALDEHIGDTARRIVRFGADPERVLLTDRLPGEDPLESLAAMVSQYRPTFLGIDSLANLAALAGIDDASSSAKMTPFMMRLVSIAHAGGPAMVLIGHGRKSDGTYRDSTAIGATVDAIIEMREGADACERELRIRARWPAENVTVRLCGNLLDPDAPLWYDRDGESLGLDVRVYLFVQVHPRCSGRDVKRNVRGRGTEIDRALEQLAGRGAIENVGTDSRPAFVTVPGSVLGIALEPPVEGPNDSDISPYGTRAEAGGNQSRNHSTAPASLPRTQPYQGSEAVPHSEAMSVRPLEDWL